MTGNTRLQENRQNVERRSTMAFDTLPEWTAVIVLVAFQRLGFRCDVHLRSRPMLDCSPSNVLIASCIACSAFGRKLSLRRRRSERRA